MIKTILPVDKTHIV